MTNLQNLLWSNNETPMDAAEKAAMRKLIEMDGEEKTEFHKDDFLFIKELPSAFIQVKR